MQFRVEHDRVRVPVGAPAKEVGAPASPSLNLVRVRMLIPLGVFLSGLSWPPLIRYSRTLFFHNSWRKPSLIVTFRQWKGK